MKHPPKRTPPALSELIKISREVGRDPDLVQGGGGNTSVKSRDGETMFVKASGTSLADMDETRGWAELDLRAARDLAGERGLLKLPPSVREARVLSLLQATVLRPLGARPSVETSLHALLDRVVIHTHPVHLNTILCARDSREAYRELLKRVDSEPLYLRYFDPGFVLGMRLAREMERYAEEHGEKPNVVFLENHGLFVSTGAIKSCLELNRRVTQLGGRRAGKARVNPVEFAWIDRGALGSKPGATSKQNGTSSRRSSVDTATQDSTAELRGALRRGGCAPLVLRRDATAIAAELVRAPAAVTQARRGAFTPDQIVYCRTHPLVLNGASPASWDRAVTRYREKYSVDPRVILRPGVGVYYAAPSLPELRVVSEVYRSAIAVILRNAQGGARFLTRKQAGFIEGWEVEAFRAQLMSDSGKTLSGRVALVTGAASGLGKGIARGLIEAGAMVVACDIDERLLEEVSRTFPHGAYLPLVIDVTDERSVDQAFLGAERAAGGIDILVNAAGIAPAFPLVDFPLGAWQKTLELNLTGYFLCAREAARLLLRQNAGGSIINVTSKSGLDASKSNSAYNATKAGEIHLMRGWALELGEAGIRVNCVAPGNVFKGSKIWNPEYIRAAAKKKGIRPEEVIPYYTSLSPLGREIEPEDVANSVLYLVSDAGRNVTGQTLVVDGGQVMVR